MKIDIDNFLDELSYTDPKYKKDIEIIEKKFNCKISCDVEKHNSLQYTYYYEVDFGVQEYFYVEIESGINNGTRLNSAEWGLQTKPESRTINVLKDVVLDRDWYIQRGQALALKKAEALLSAYKHKFFEYERQNNYDNYVTGGNSKLKFDELLSQLHVKYIYEEKEVDVNFI